MSFDSAPNEKVINRATSSPTVASKVSKLQVISEEETLEEAQQELRK